MQILIRVRNTLILFFVFLSPSQPVFAQAQVVYHIDNPQTQGMKALGHIENQLETAPHTKIIVVVHSAGVEMMKNGAKDSNSVEYAPIISKLVDKGVDFEVCEFTMRSRHLSKAEIIPQSGYTASGVVRLTSLQNEGKFAYIKP